MLDGDTSSVREIRTGQLVPSDPQFSADGRWLAFVASEVKQCCSSFRSSFPPQVISSELWIARADGSDAHAVGALTFSAAIGWDPHADLFAVGVGSSTSVPFGNATGIDLVSPTGAVKSLVNGTNIWGAVWAPDASAIAVASSVRSSGFNGYASVLASYPLDGDPPTQWYEVDTQQANIIVPAGWWQGWGIGYTTVGEGAVPGGSGSADGSPFYTIAKPGATPLLLGTTLETEGAGAPSVNSSGLMAFVSNEMNRNEGRDITQGKEVLVCQLANSSCTPVPHASDAVTEDPAWAPTSSVLDYVQAPATHSLLQYSVTGWYAARRLYTFNAVTGAGEPKAGTSGATSPQWSTDGKTLLYVSNDGLWIRSASASESTEIESPLFVPQKWPSYYGQVAFTSQFSWWPSST
ncbi:MAG TPA: hypothetical protein VEJ87_13280 [Acidimicrobiales bacterium]|nr:hypothetical protein [Acidimicrobiales bacterium]